MLFEDFDKKIKEAADQHHPPYDEKAWRKMEKLLDQHLPQQKDDRRRILFFLLLLLLIGGVTYIAISKPWNKKPGSSQFVQKNQTGIQDATRKNSNKNDISTSISGSDKIDEPRSKESIKVSSEEKKFNPEKIVGNSPVNKKSQPNISYGQGIEKNKSATIKSSSFLVNNADQYNNIGINNDGKRDDKKIISGKIKEQTANLNSQEKNNDDDKISIIPIDTNEIKTNKSQQISETDSKTKTQSKKAISNKNGFSFLVSIGPDVSKAGASKTGKTTLVYGAGIGYTFNRFTVKTGIYASKKIYWAGPNDYKLSYSPPPSTKFEGADANCRVIEIPLKLNYAFDVKNKSNWFAGVGLSSYLMKMEKYVYTYKSASSIYYYPYQAKNENKHYFSVLDLSAGYKRQINHTLSVSAEPYVEIPLTGIGVGKVHLNSGGILFTIDIKPFRK